MENVIKRRCIAVGSPVGGSRGLLLCVPEVSFPLSCSGVVGEQLSYLPCNGFYRVGSFLLTL